MLYIDIYQVDGNEVMTPARESQQEPVEGYLYTLIIDGDNVRKHYESV